jgi:hypothetical protein
VRPPENHRPIQGGEFLDVILSLDLPNRPYVKEADKPGLSGKPQNPKIGQVLRPVGAILSNATFLSPPENH